MSRGLSEPHRAGLKLDCGGLLDKIELMDDEVAGTSLVCQFWLSALQSAGQPSVNEIKSSSPMTGFVRVSPHGQQVNLGRGRNRAF